MRPLPTAPGSRPLRGSWGFLETTIARYGEMRVRLVILPPDTTDLERRLWVLMRLWPFVGLIVGVAAGLLLSDILGTAATVVLAAVVWLAPAIALWVGMGPFLGRIREEWVTCAIGCEDSDLRRRELNRVARALSYAEESWRAGRRSRGDFEATWAGAWDRFAPRVTS
ncbi:MULTISPECIES: DUF6611 family protein [unclassified Microbacterium]|uniref:DUF6611 family protein n=1 Tax=unclassified Microbacterium TaxID=2609290 RepID=UPI000F5565E3|nr:DUF6611 family protein [Microbacterium sp. ABRD28]AZC12829.1 hypothetical protein DT073_03090 [Microbacterium sp. ABRD28]